MRALILSICVLALACIQPVAAQKLDLSELYSAYGNFMGQRYICEDTEGLSLSDLESAFEQDILALGHSPEEARDQAHRPMLVIERLREMPRSPDFQGMSEEDCRQSETTVSSNLARARLNLGLGDGAEQP